MKNIYKVLFIMMFVSFTNSFSNSVVAAVGDTTVVQAHSTVTMSNYGNYDAWAVFPNTGTAYGKVMMRYRLGCPPSGCSPWDYTTQVTARVKNGMFDSTLTEYPKFTIDGAIIDTTYTTTNLTYITFYNSITQSTDSSVSNLITIAIYGDSLNPTTITNTLYQFPGNYYNYYYNTSGVIVDSSYVSFTTTWILDYYDVYSAPFPVVEPYELARVMTPYAQGYPISWYRDYWYNVTDYQTVLKDSVLMRVFYDGYSSGFTADVSFYFIEGTAPRTPIRVRNIYPVRYYKYGLASDPIESYLVPKKFEVTTGEEQALIRVIPSGHSFGGALNCAEFCQKNYRFVIDGTQRFTQLIWRNDCGLNPLFGQPGTWLYDRSNWCPGDKALSREHELTPFITPGDSVIVDMNLDTYTYNGGAGFDPGYYLTTHLVTYGTNNFVTNASLEEIIAPNNEFEYSRFNPICNNPIVKIKNNGSATLTSCVIHYGIKGGVQQTYNWTGSLVFNSTATVTLGNLVWGSAGLTPTDFEAWIDNPNGTADQYPSDDTLRSKVGFTPVYPSQFRLLWKTNNAANETTYQLRDDLGNLLFSNGALAANTIYSDTFNLAPGCYELKISDSGKDGLSFFANSDGTGYARLVKTDGSNSIMKIFPADFGTSIIQRFTVGYFTSLDEQVNNTIFELSPNPTNGKFAVNLILSDRLDVTVLVHNQVGQLIYQEAKPDFYQDVFNVDLGDQKPGMYFVSIITKEGKTTKKLLIY